MAKIDGLLKMKVVMAVGEFTADGKLVNYKANMPMTTVVFSLLYDALVRMK